ncbi:nucleoside hydrolase [Kaistia geumhonensis]|uniref:Inosine-uridine nucleoside N-ribohydrolase n=1 Tax=Kaistia geumhonensis TaxID=410839 RepID=A0ABU0M2I3_9HYPH|nr:nucleoside hydrolase [Kaistia geumhonensis]MCX5479610.1 nucleoside hydrolase [Kaistia geumhonensis]MDQ0515167.1 inosine-uridine nucleoside N-ribohydrolase [Kaistia geumhonensis]
MIDLLHDCDPGNDDAVGILAALGHPAVNLVAVTTGAGHLAFDRTAENAAITVAAARPRTVPVSRGAEGPLLRERMIARILDFESGLDSDRPDLDRVALDPLHSVDQIAAAARAHPGLTIVMTGPFTNLALALRRHPQVKDGIGRIVTLGGAWGLGTKTAAAEWNILCDPEAAAIVYGSGIPVTMVPVDASATVPIDDPLVARVAALPGPAAALAAELLASLRTTHRPGVFAPAEMPLHDPCAILAAADPALVTTVPARVDIETTSGLNYGRTVVDFAGRTDRPNNCDVVIAFDVAATQDALVGAIAALSRLQQGA